MHGKITKLQSLCSSLKEIISYNEKIVQKTFQFGSVNSRNLQPLTELITKAIEGTAPFVILSAQENWRQAFEVNEPRTPELVNFVFSRQTGIQSASIRFRLINRLSHCTKRTAINLGFKTLSKQQAPHAQLY